MMPTKYQTKDRRAGLDATFKARDVADEKLQQAWRARRAMYQMLPGLTALANSVSKSFGGPTDLEVRIGDGPVIVDNKYIYLPPMMELGLERRHDRRLCSLRGDDDVMLCPACDALDVVSGSFFHEIAHAVAGSFDKITDSQRIATIQQVMAEAEKLWPGSKRIATIRQRVESVASTVADYKLVGEQVSPWYRNVHQALEDARVNHFMYQSLEGTRRMFTGKANRIAAKGIELEDGTVVHWNEVPLGTQMGLGLLMMASDHQHLLKFLDPAVEEAAQDAELQELCSLAVKQPHVRELFALSFRVLERCRALGFFQHEDDPEDDPPPPPPASLNKDPQPQDSDDEQESDDEGESGEGEQSDSSDESSDPSDEQDDGDASSADDPDTDQDESDGSGASSDEADDDEGEEADDAAGDGSSDDDAEPDESGSSAPADADSESGDDDSDDESDAPGSEESADEQDASESDESGGDSSDSDGDESDAAQMQPGADTDVDADDADQSDADADDGDQSDGIGDQATGETEPVDVDQDEYELGHDSGQTSGMHNTGDDGEVVEPDDDDEPEPDDEPLDMGDPEDAFEALMLFGEHSEPGEVERDDMDMEEIAAIELAMIQGQHFDAPSPNVLNFYLNKFDAGMRPGKGYDAWDRAGKLRGNWRHRVDQIMPSEHILGPALLRLRRAFAENKKAKGKSSRSGRINAPRLASVKAGNKEVFLRTQLPGKRDYAVIIMTDNSGSTAASNRIVIIKEMTMALGELMHRVGVKKFAMYAHEGQGVNDTMGRGNQKYEQDVWELKAFEEPWDNRTRERVALLAPGDRNLDGHAMEFARKTIERVSATNKIVLYVTDGRMPDANREEETPILKRELNTLRKLGIPVVGVGINTESPKQHGLDTVVVNHSGDIHRVIQKMEEYLT